MHSWSGVADAYRDSFGTLCEGTVERLLVDTSGVSHLDVGCGSGTLAARASALGREVVAVDADPDMVAISQTLVPGRVLEGSVPALPFDDDQFDARQRRQSYGVVVDTFTRPDRSRMGREYSVESLLISLLPNRRADRALAAVSAR